MSSQQNKRAVFGWVLYDWANSAFAMTVLAAFFPVFFKSYWCAGQGAGFTTTKLGLGNALAGLLVALLSPLLGALADAGRSRKSFLIAFMLLGTVLTALLSLVGEGRWQLALGVFIIANFGWACANLFYDALLPAVAVREKLDATSSLGYATGYLGCAILFMLNILMVSRPQIFGLADKVQAVKLSFITVSAWWLVFAVPLVLFVHETGTAGPAHPVRIIREGVQRLGRTLGEIRSFRHVWLFLIAYWLYIDGVDTFIRMAADLGLSIGLDASGLMKALLIVQLVAFPAALLFGVLAKRIGTINSLLAGIGIYVFVTVAGPFWVHTQGQYTVMAVLSALPLGCLQALSRSYYASIIPEQRTAEFFGFYNLMGKFAAIFGPAMVAVVAFAFERQGASSDLAARWGFASIAFLFIAGGILLVNAGKKTHARQPSRRPAS